MRKSRQIWTKKEIIIVLKKLPSDKFINKKVLMEYYKLGILPFWPGTIADRFGSIKEACGLAGIKCGALYGREKMEYMTKLNIKYTKDKIIEILKEGYKRYGVLSPTQLILKINEDNKIDVRGAIKKHFGKIVDALDAANIPYKNYYWTNERILDTLRKLYDENGKFLKTDINTRFHKEDKICGAKLIRDRFVSLDDAADEAGITFKEFIITGRIGKYEKDILDEIELEKGIEIIRQFPVAGKFLDGYDMINKKAYEIDGPEHKDKVVEDFLREKLVTDVLGCKFERIKIY